MLRHLVALCLFGLALNIGEAAGQSAQRPFKLAPQRPGETDVYVVSLGLWGAQGVFESEAKGATRILEEKLGAKDRAIILFNTKRRMAVTDATASAAAKAIGQVLDPNEDVALLFLTSHGGPEGVGVTTRGRNVQVLSPTYAAQLLRDMRARYRVLIVSACFSGVFAKALADDRTLVITAASADRSSFGCEDRATWTYFGDAFFNRSLRTEPRLDAAFAKAKALVTQREKREGFDPSDPQIAGGSQVLERLNAR